MNKKIYIGLIGVALILSISGTAIYAMTEVSVSNHFSTGIVDIELNEYRKNGDGTETYGVMLQISFRERKYRKFQELQIMAMTATYGQR